MRLYQASIFASIFGASVANLLTPLPPSASDEALKWQPVLDFDKDTCYHVAAVDAHLNTNEGLPPTASESKCRTAEHLWHSNVYSRQRCNHYWCAYMYAYYSEMDSAFWNLAEGHRHDWEHAIVWTLHNQVTYVSWSHHGDYSTVHHTGVRFEGTHPKLVAHHGGVRTASLRLATPGDDKIENHLGKWFTGHLVGMEKMAPGFWRALTNKDWGSAHLDLKSSAFADALDDAMPWDARHNEGFDAFND